MIKTEHLVKRYGPLLAVDDVSFEARPGEVLGFLGPNGAGKTTSMRMLAGFIAPSSGRASICGHDVEQDAIAAKACLGYLPEGAPLYGEMRVLDFLRFIAELRELTGPRRARLDYVIERLQLAPVLQQSIETLSKGFRRRVGLAQAIMHDPPALILDEPTDGLDPNQKHEVRALIRRMGEKKAIIFSTHILEEVEAACSRAIIIDRGQIVANGTPRELKMKSDLAGAVTLRVLGVPSAEIKDKLGSLPMAKKTVILREETGGVSVRAYPQTGALNGELARQVSDIAAKAGWKFDELHTEEGRLDEVFRSITLPDTAKERK